MSDNTRGATRLVLGGPPRADLLPPEYAAAAKLKAQRRFMAILVIFALVLVGLGVGYAVVLAGTKSQALAAANTETTSLINQQKEYEEVGQIDQQIKTIEVAKVIGVSTEIDWLLYLTLVQASLPPGTVLNTVSASTAYPGSGSTTSESPLGATSIAKISFSAETPTLPDVSSWIENLSTLPGYGGSTAGSITLCDCGSFLVTMDLYVNEDALSDRFPPADDAAEGEGEETDADDEPAEEPSETPSASPSPSSAPTRLTVKR